MADLGGVFGGQFNANNVTPNAGFDIIPAGTEADAIIVKSEVKPTSNGNGGTRLELELQIINGPFQNRKLWDGLNIKNPSEKAQQIGQGTLSQICRCVNVLTPKDTSELHDKPLKVSIGVEKKDDGSLKNNIKAYKPRHATSAPPAPAQYANSAGQPGQLQTAGAPSAPWAGQ